SLQTSYCGGRHQLYMGMDCRQEILSVFMTLLRQISWPWNLKMRWGEYLMWQLETLLQFFNCLTCSNQSQRLEILCTSLAHKGRGILGMVLHQLKKSQVLVTCPKFQ